MYIHMYINKLLTFFCFFSINAIIDVTGIVPQVSSNAAETETVEKQRSNTDELFLDRSNNNSGISLNK